MPPIEPPAPPMPKFVSPHSPQPSHSRQNSYMKSKPPFDVSSPNKNFHANQINPPYNPKHSPPPKRSPNHSHQNSISLDGVSTTQHEGLGNSANISVTNSVKFGTKQSINSNSLNPFDDYELDDFGANR